MPQQRHKGNSHLLAPLEGRCPLQPPHELLEAKVRLHVRRVHVDQRSQQVDHSRTKLVAVPVLVAAEEPLESLARHHPDLRPHLAPAGASASERHRRLVQCVLPRFSMTCVTSAEREANERRRAEVAAIKRQRDEQREHDAAEEDGGVLL